MAHWLLPVVNGLGYGLLLFMLSAGLTLTFSMMGVINFAHASFYMLGAYLAYALGGLSAGLPGVAPAAFWAGLCLAPLATGLLGALLEYAGLRRLRHQGHVAELLFTFALSFVMVELVQLFWGRMPVPYRLPEALEQPLFVVAGQAVPAYRALVVAVAGLMLAGLGGLLWRTRVGLVIQAAIARPQMTMALGHNVPRLFVWVFAAGCMLAGLAGAVGGAVSTTEPGMALAVGAIVFVVTVVGGLGSLAGAFWASLLIGVVQTVAVGIDLSAAALLGLADAEEAWWMPLAQMPVSRLAPVLPYLLMVLVLAWRPRGLSGRRET